MVLRISGSAALKRKTKSKKKSAAANVLKKLSDGDERTLASIMTHVQDAAESSNQLLSQIYSQLEKKPAKKPLVIGITGAPGVGKSSLLDALLREIPHLAVGVLLIDPSSPFTGGALLGDRVRLQGKISPLHFIRSVGSRGERGGLCRASRDLLRVFALAGKKIIFIETVGVGQNEYEIMNLADVSVLILSPSSGDVVQTLKAGIMEIADLFVVNKADLPGSQELSADLRALGDPSKVMETVATSGHGVKALWETLEALALKKQREAAKRDSSARFAREVAQRVGENLESEIFKRLLKRFNQAKSKKSRRPAPTDPYLTAQNILKVLLNSLPK